MTNFFVHNDPNYRAITQTDDGRFVAFPNADGKIDIRNPVEVSGFDAISDNATLTERSHLPDPIIESVITKFTQTFPI